MASNSGITPSKPGNTPSKPGIASSKPGNTPAKPGNTPAKPGSTPAKSGNTPAKPGNTSSKSENTSSKPGITPAKHGNTSLKQENTSSKPGITPAKPENTPAKPESTPTHPGNTSLTLGNTDSNLEARSQKESSHQEVASHVDESETPGPRSFIGQEPDDDEIPPISAQEQAEQAEFDRTLKRYNRIARKLREHALNREKRHLILMDHSPIVRYYDGPRGRRIKHINEELEELGAMEKLVAARKRQP